MQPQGRRTLWLARTGLWIAVALVVALQVAGALNRPVRDRLADLHVYWGSVRVLLDGGSLYDFAAWNDAPFTYPPFAGLLFTPLALIAEAPLRALWTSATIGVVIGLAVLVRRADGLRWIDPALRVPVVALLLFGSAPVSSNLRFGQISVVLVALVLVDCLGIMPTRYRGALTGIAAAIKLTPMIFVVYWWVSGQRRTAINAVAAFGACTGVAWLVLPGESVRSGSPRSGT
ncbi:glycosyltransferase family 87 protein [Micromonospora sp. B11E3]|uniref:glycosyltransferase family 87 protein n=1 Tax=Micromonospora sp. B11E3 TaxID=3153562 RepID=UPI00325F2AAA